MALNPSQANVKKISLIFGLLVLVLSATTVSASFQTSVAYLNSETYANGNAIPVHDGTTYIDADNASSSRNSMYAKIRRSLKFAPDPIMYSKSVSPGNSIYQPVSIPEPSQYYAVADSVRYPIHGSVRFTEYY